MIGRALLCTMAAATLASGGLTISIVEHGEERLLYSACTLPAAEVGAVVQVKFRVRSLPDAVLLDHLDLKGADLRIDPKPTLPIMVWPGAYVDVDVQYRPSLPGSGSGTLEVNDRTITIVTQALAAPEIRAETGEILYVGEPYGFGEAELGSSITRRFRVDNPTGERATITRLEVAGTGFRGTFPPVPFQLEAGASAEFDVTFEPQSEGRIGAFLYLNSREYSLEGSATAPPLSKPELVVQPAALRSGMQGSISVRLPAASTWAAQGVLRMAFDGPTDPSVRLIGGDGRAVAFTVPEGESVARFGSAEAASFQTGSTAGRITFTVELGSYNEQVVADVAPAAVEFDTATAKRASSSVEVRFTGFDNTRSISSVAFTFRDTSGRLIGSGPIRSDVSTGFRTYFDASGYGGTFSLLAVFPVRGNTSEIGSVDIEVTNSQGAANRSVTMTE